MQNYEIGINVMGSIAYQMPRVISKATGNGEIMFQFSTVQRGARLLAFAVAFEGCSVWNIIIKQQAISESLNRAAQYEGGYICFDLCSQE